MIGDFKQHEVLGSLSPCCVLASLRGSHFGVRKTDAEKVSAFYDQ